MSMQQVAAVVGVAWQSVQQWEKRTVPQPEKMEPLAAALRTTPEYLLFGRGEVSQLGNITMGTKHRVGPWPFTTYITPERWGGLTEAQRAVVEWTAFQELQRLEVAAGAVALPGKRGVA